MATMNDKIKELRKRKNITLLEMADFLGVKESTAQRYESGSIKSMRYETICKLAELFDCDPGYIMGWKDTPGTFNVTITNSSVVNGNHASSLILQTGVEESREMTDQAAELLRIFNSLSVKGQTILLSRAFELEEKYSKD